MIYVWWKLVIIKTDGLEEWQGEFSLRVDSWEVENESSRRSPGETQSYARLLLGTKAAGTRASGL